MELTYTEENYLKAIYQLSKQGQQPVSTNALAAILHTSPAAVTDMIQRLNQKELVSYQKYQGVNMAELGQKQVLQVLRKQRLWEVFLVNKLKFAWDEVADAAEQLEHIQSGLLIQRLDDFLGNPVYSPYGEPIPDKQGKINTQPQWILSQLEEGNTAILMSVKEGTPLFLQYLSKRGIYIGASIKVVEKIVFDQSMDISIDGLPQFNISLKVSDNLLVAAKELN